MNDDSRTFTQDASSQAPHDVALWRGAVRKELAALPGPAQERSRIEDELAQMLRDEAEAGGIECQSPTAVESWLASQRHRFETLVAELVNSLPQDEVEASALASAPTAGMGTGFAILSGIQADLKVALRALLKRPALTAVILATLVLGIGLNSAVFSILNSVLFKPMAVVQPEQLMRIYSVVPNDFVLEGPSAAPDLMDLRSSEAVADLAAHALTFSALSIDESAEIVVAEMVTDNFFELLGVPPLRGRLFASGDQTVPYGSEGDTLVISAAAWGRLFDSDPDVVGRVVRLNGHPLEIVGVVPADFRGLLRGLEPAVWVPVSTALRIGATPSTNSGTATMESLLEDRGRRWLWGVARLADGLSADQAGAEMENIAAALKAEFPDTNDDRDVSIIPLSNVKVMPAFDSSIDTVSAVLLGLVFLVLLIASANLANLLLARALARRGEMATRLSLGASRSRIVRQLLVESLLLAALGAAGGLMVAYLASWLMSRVRIDMVVPLQVSVSPDLRVVVFTVLIATLTAVLFGLVPAIEASRTDLASVMKESAGRGGRRMRFQSTMVALQVAFSVVLLIFAGLALRSVVNATNINTGMQTAGVAGIMLAPESQGYEETEVVGFYEELHRRIEASPGVQRVSSASHLPLSLFINTNPAVPSRRAGEDQDTWPQVDTGSVDDAYFDVLGIPMLRGRAFTQGELDQEARVVVINQTLAEKFWPGEEAVGELLVTNPESDPYRVVGVVGNGKYRTLGEEARSFAYFPLRANTSMRTVVARFDRPQQATGRLFEDLAHGIDPHLAIANSGSVEELTSSSVLIPKIAAAVFGVLGLVGLLLSAIGLFGVLAYSVSQRTHEIGLRIAMGASRGRVMALVARRGLTLVGFGVALGTAVAVGVTRFLSAMLYGISATDGLTFVLVVVVLLAVALIATLVPARAALRVSPTEALRYE